MWGMGWWLSCSTGVLLNWSHMAVVYLVCIGEGVGVRPHSQAPYTSRMGSMDQGRPTRVLAAGLRSRSAVGWGPWKAQTALQGLLTAAFGTGWGFPESQLFRRGVHTQLGEGRKCVLAVGGGGSNTEPGMRQAPPSGRSLLT